jgi:steroid delta-isomerase-like uncharacterized protein
MSPEENKAIVRNYIQAVWNEGDMQTVDDVVVPDFVQHVGMVNQGREGIHRFFAMVRAAFPDIRNTADEVLADGDKVYVRSTITGTHRGTFFGVPPTGKAVNFTAMNIIRLHDGQLVENWGEQDLAGLMRQLGAMPDWDSVQPFSELLHKGFPDLVVEIEDQLVDGDKVVTRKTLRGTHLGAFKGVAPTGRNVTISAIDEVVMKNGQLTAHRYVFDQLGLLRQLGVAPTPG